MPARTALKLGAALSLALAIPAFAQESSVAPPSADTVMATVDGTEITLGQMIVLRASLPEQYRQLPDEVLFDGILEQLVRQTLLAGAAQGTSPLIEIQLENERRALLANEIIRDVAIDAVTEEAVQAAYDEAIANMPSMEEFNASHILVETEEAAAALIEQLNGGADFATLAQEHSTGPTGPNGGNLNWFQAGQMVAPFEEAVMTLEVGAISAAPVQTQFGWHVIKLNDKRQQTAPTLEELRPDLTEMIQQEAVEAEIDRLLAGADVMRPDTSGIDRSVLSDLSLVEN